MGIFGNIVGFVRYGLPNLPNAIKEAQELRRILKEHRSMTMQLSTDQKTKILQIIGIFETGKKEGDYGLVTLLKGDTGGLTYGKHQTTLNSGNLYLLIRDYLEQPLAEKRELQNWLKPLREKNQKLNRDNAFKTLLAEAGKDPVMQAVQDDFFEKAYWMPALQWANKNGFVLPLSMAVLYDSFIHSGQVPMYLRNRFKEPVPVNGGKEKEWVKAYVATRDNWLRHHQNTLLHKTVYRTEAFQKLIDQNNWQLESPFKVRSFTL